MSKIKKFRSIKLVKQFIKELELDLRGLTIITELGSNNYMLTPIIGILAGAEKVIAFVSDSSYGKSDEIILSFNENFPESVFQSKIEIKKVLTKGDYSKADIITNSRPLRPINRSKIKNFSPNTIVLLMYDIWEIRDFDIDVKECNKNNIMIAGTNESTNFFPIFEYCGLLATKMAFEAGYEIRQNNILIWSRDEFGETIKKEFEALGANKIIMTTDFSVVEKQIESLDFIFLTDYHETRSFTNNDNFFNLKLLKEKNKNIGIIHLYGEIDHSYCKKNSISLFPYKNGYSSKMSLTLDYLGLIPLIKLLTASFKVGECLIKGMENKLVQPVNISYDSKLKKYTFKS